MALNLPTAAKYIRECLENPRCTRIGFEATRTARLPKTVVARPTRNGQDFWYGNENRGRLAGHTDSYPRIDLRKAGIFENPSLITQEEFLSDSLPKIVSERLRALLADVEVYIRPLHKNFPTLDWNDPEWRLHMKFVLPNGVPDWLTGVEDLRMTGTWEAFIDPISKERNLADALCRQENHARKIVRLRRQSEEALAAVAIYEGELPQLMQAAESLVAELQG